MCSFSFAFSDRKILGRFCGKRTESKTLMSSSQAIHVEFQSDAFIEYEGFKLRYEFIKEDTGTKKKMLSKSVITRMKRENTCLLKSNYLNNQVKGKFYFKT